MASLTYITSFIFTLLLTTSSSSTTQETPQQLQINSIIDPVVGAGDFINWANLLSQADLYFFPLSATMFIPDDTALASQNLSSISSSSSSPSWSSSSTVNFLDPLLFPYHDVPRRFDFIDLLQFPTGACLPTLLSGNTILITNNSADNFTINGSHITHSDLFQNALVSAHGVGKVLDYTLYGKVSDILWTVSSESVPAMSPAQDSVVGPTSTVDDGPLIGPPTSDGGERWLSFGFLATALVLVVFVARLIPPEIFYYWLSTGFFEFVYAMSFVFVWSFWFLYQRLLRCFPTL